MEFPDKSALYALLGGIVLLYISARALADALVGDRHGTPALRAVAQCIPIAATAVVACYLRHFEVAVGLLFATAVASLALANGVVIYLTPPGVIEAKWKSIWPFVLPAAVLALLAGFSGHLKLTHAFMFVLEGAAVLMVWRGAASDEADVVVRSASPAGGFTVTVTQMNNGPPPIAENVPTRPPRSAWRALYLLLAIGLAGLGAWLCARGAIQTGGQVQALSAGVVAAVLLGPGLILSQLGNSTLLAAEGRSAEALTSNVIVALVNLCVVLPIVIALGYLLPMVREFRATPRHPGVASILEMIVSHMDPILFPLRVWRVDTVALIVLGMSLIPAATGMWPLSKREGTGLILGYIAYLMMVTNFALRST
jgi:hypothetical protein